MTAGEPPRARPPSVDRLARSQSSTGLPHPVLVDLARSSIADGTVDDFATAATAAAADRLRDVINATGVLLHTNLGRAPLGVSTRAYASNLELDLATGQRGDRQRQIGRLLAVACGAEAAGALNNGAAALLLTLAALAAGRGVAVSRGELVEIGGGFRLPEVLASSGARLVEVGTTNRTSIDDYRRAVASGAADLVLKVHPSNFRVEGFTRSVPVRVLADLGVPVVVDVGSGLLDRRCPWLPDGPPGWLGDEPAVRQTLAEGASLVTFSGDKLLGGPQAGLIAGSAAFVDACLSHPLARAVRPGGLVLRALQDIVLAYLRRDLEALPFWCLATASVESLRRRAAAIAASLPGAAIVDCNSVPGAGSVPGATIPSVGLRLSGDHSAALRNQPIPIVARVESGATTLDLRTVWPDDDHRVAEALTSLA